MFEFALGLASGVVLAVLSPKVFTYVAQLIAKAKSIDK